MSKLKQQRQPAVAGQFYPETRESLEADLKRCFQHAPEGSTTKNIRALIVPHAGYQYSGQTAGQAFGLLRGAEGIERVVVIAPSHRAFLHGVSLGDYRSFLTPLGEITVDDQTCQNLIGKSPLISNKCNAHALEHALEVQLPFIQTVLPNVTLVPIVCGDLNRDDVHALARSLAEELWRKDTVWIISSDFTHFGEAFGYVPFKNKVPQRLKELDMGAIDQIERMTCDGFLDYVERTGATICGRLPIALLLAALEQTDDQLHCQLLEYTTSGQMTHDYEHSVSYASIAVTQTTASETESRAEQTVDFELTPEDQNFLLGLARKTITATLNGKTIAAPDLESLSPTLKNDGACFVTLHIDGNLRGCIGYLEAAEPLYENVMRNANSAAFEDSRFLPLTTEELPNIEIEISVLTPHRPIASPDEFIVGKHGIILQKGAYRSVFLPQVAPEQGWDTETTLSFLARKAGLAPHAWRHGASLFVFEAIVFGE